MSGWSIGREVVHMPSDVCGVAREQLMQEGNPANNAEGHAGPVGQRGSLPVKVQELLLFILFPQAAVVDRGRRLVPQGC